MMKINWNIKPTIGVVTTCAVLLMIGLIYTLWINSEKNQTIKALQDIQVEQEEELNALNISLHEEATKLANLEDSLQVYQEKLTAIQIKKQVAERVFKSKIKHLKQVVRQKETALQQERNRIINHKNQIIYEN